MVQGLTKQDYRQLAGMQISYIGNARICIRLFLRGLAETPTRDSAFFLSEGTYKKKRVLLVYFRPTIRQGLRHSWERHLGPMQKKVLMVDFPSFKTVDD